MNIDSLYNYTLIDCLRDSDCPGSSLCFYLNNTNPKMGFCCCNSELGDTGDLCNELSNYSYLRLSVMSGVFFVVFCIFCYIFYQLLIIDRTKIKRFDVKVTTLIECIFALSFLMLYEAAGILWILSPNSTTIDEVSGRKKRPAGIGRNLGVSGAAFFLVAASLNVSILWLEVAIASKRFKKINNPQLSKKYQLAVSIFDVIAVLSIALINWFMPPLTPIFGIIVFSIVVIM